MATYNRDLFAALVSTQHGVVSRLQAYEAGMSRAQVNYRLSSGDWVSIHPGVYRMSTSPPTRAALAVAGLLSAPRGSVFSHHTAARLHKLDIRPKSDQVWVSIPHKYRRTELRGVTFLRSRQLQGFTTSVYDQPVTTVARTLVDLGDLLSGRRLTAAVYDSIRIKATTAEELRIAAAALANRSTESSIYQVLKTFEEGFDSGLEAYADGIFRKHGLIF